MSYTPLTLTCADNFINNRGLTLDNQREHLAQYLNVPTVNKITELGNIIIGRFQSSVISASWVSGIGGGTATLLLSSTPDYIVGDSVSVIGVSESGYNGNKILTAVSGNTISFDASSPLNAATGGSTSLPAPNFFSLGQTIFPGLLNSMPVEYGVAANNVTLPGEIDGFAGYVLRQGTAVYDLGDYSKIGAVWSQAAGYVSTINEVINSSLHSNVKDAVFISHDASMTSNLSAVTTDIKLFVADLAKTGEYYSGEYNISIDNPARLLRKIDQAKGLPQILQVMLDNGLSTDDIQALQTDSEPPLILCKTLYNIMQTVTGTELTAILNLMSITTPNIDKLTDLLDIRKLFPTSIDTLISPTKNGILPLVNITKDDLYVTVSGILPENIAVLALAFRTSLQQITDIDKLDMQTIVAVGKELQVTNDLSDLSTTAMLGSAKSSLDSIFAIGTGENGTLVQADVLGSSLGYVHGELFFQLGELLLDLTDIQPLLTKINATLAIAHTASRSTLQTAYNEIVAMSPLIVSAT